MEVELIFKKDDRRSRAVGVGREADGLGSFPAGSQTTISVPSVEFPDGYQVSVTGGEVVSAPHAADLVIASNAGASTVAVTVSPAGT
jgi:endoglycosylceramidase